MKEKQDDNLFFIRDKTKIMISFSKQDLDKKNTKEDLDMVAEYSKEVAIFKTANLSLGVNLMQALCKAAAEVLAEKFRAALLWLQQKKFIRCDKDIGTIKNTEYFEVTILKEKLFHCDTNFVLLNMHEYETIINSKTSSKKNVLLATYLYIKKGVYYNENIPTPKLMVTSHDNIKRVLGVSSNTTVKSALADLKSLGLLYWDDTQYFYHDVKKDVYKPTKNAYALTQKDLKYTKEMLEDFAYLGEETAREMSLGVTKLMKTSVGVGITGIVCPNSDGTDKKVGLIFISITHNGKTDVIKLENNFSDDVRYKNRFTAVKTILEFLGDKNYAE